MNATVTGNLDSFFNECLVRIEKNVQFGLNAMAESGAELARERTESDYAKTGDYSDGTASRSFYTSTPGQEPVVNYESAASATYMQGDPSKAPRADLVMDELEAAPMEALFASADLVVGFWEYGHRNVFTGTIKGPKWEPPVPVVRSIELELRHSDKKQFFPNLLAPLL